MAAVSAVAAAPVISQVVMDSNATTTIISNINSLYNNIFTFVAVLVTLAGVVFPIALTRYQNKKLRNNQNRLTELIESEIASAKTKLIDDLKKELVLEIEKSEKNISNIKDELNQRISESVADLNGKAHHGQANISFGKQLYNQALMDYLIAASDYVAAKDEFNLRRVIPSIISTLKMTNQESLENLEGLEKQFEKAIAKIQSINKAGGYSDDIHNMKVELKAAKARK